MTRLEINMGIKELPKGVSAITLGTVVPLTFVKLGSQSVSASFLRPLFAASTATLKRLSVVLNARTTANLILACPVAFPHLVELRVESLRNAITSVERKFFPLLAECTNLRSLGWEWCEFYELAGAVRFLPDAGARLEYIGFSMFGVSQWAKAREVRFFLGGSNLARLREATVYGVTGPPETAEAVRKFCRDRRIKVHC